MEQVVLIKMKKERSEKTLLGLPVQQFSSSGRFVSTIDAGRSRLFVLVVNAVLSSGNAG